MPCLALERSELFKFRMCQGSGMPALSIAGPAKLQAAGTSLQPFAQGYHDMPCSAAECLEGTDSSLS